MLFRRVLLVALIVACLPVPAAVAQAPQGDWTFVREDGYRHYACRYKVKGDWAVRTATSWGKLREDVEKYDFQTYASLARGSNENVPVEANSKSWSGGYARIVLRDARLTDRLWVQLAAYGPPAPWSDGFTVKRLKVCAR
ncbi:hypothetical protein OJ997_33905 [Solirubrobacter phytolaccae]|uniref:Uncharacterized protein n=1 Tax=Solirubrobacter phytolaccae TaxID=1404360 RepID=A0A9X3NEU4_9ACTN|nr:hypothetical protein [Solirubrobacter phytolaccae]MDA0185350.1 hypothetical protein [Solirubrobacter phytolaccae]